MSRRTRSTLKMLCVREAIVNQELPEEAQRLLEVYHDPSVSQEQKQIARTRLDDAIKRLESSVTTRRLNEKR